MVEAALKAEEERFAETLSRGMERFAEYARLGNRVASKFSDVLAMGPFFSGDDSDAGCYIRLLDGSRLSAIPVVNSGVAYIESAIDLAVDLAKLDHADHVITLVGDVEALQSLALDQLQSRYGVKIGISANSDYPVGGHAAFVLYDTYGFPVDLTADMARERGLSVDMAGFDAAMAQQREQARAASKFAGSSSLSAELVASLNPTVFLGYEHLQSEGLRVLAIVREGQALSELRAGEAATLILDRTPFYAESGGQVGDHGRLLGSALQFDVADTQKLAGVYFGHVGTLAQGVLKVGDALCGEVDSARRQAIVLNHSATHLLHAALREVLGDHVAQKGSQVAPERLRFDFSHFQPMTGAELAQVEALVNAEIRRNVAVEVHHMGMQEALDFGAMALFGEKYGEEVRVLKMGAFSTELCGGTHASRTGDIGVFKIVSEGGVASGVRRIEAVSGAGALAYIREEESRLDEVADLLGASATDVAGKLRQLLDRQRQLEKTVEQFKAKSAAGAAADLAASATDVGGFKLVAARLEGLDVKGLRDAVDNLKQKLPDAVILLASASEGKASLIAGVNGAALGKVKAGDVVGFVAAQINGKGGGRPDMAQGGGEDGPALLTALQALPTWVAARLA
ncbi:MAG: alanine--tRNA ligase [Xanthomonadales bacterium]|nr:alanine--tRNA ligase [Xanthomonadales bacterium]